MAGPFDNLPPEIALEQQRLTRQQQLANALMQNNQQPQGQMVSGRFVAPSFFQNLQPVANMLTGAYLSNKADEKSLALAQQLRDRNKADIEGYMGAMTPTTQTTELAGPYGEGVGQGNVDIPMPTAYMPAQAAVAPNPVLANQNLFADPRATQRLRDLAFNKIMADPESFTLNKGAIRFEKQPDGTTKEVAAGAPDLPDSIQYAISVGQLPANPKTWTKQQADYAKSLVESKTSAGASKYDFSNMLGKSVSDVAPILIASKTATGGAIQQADAANRIIQSLNSNKIFTGDLIWCSKSRVGADWKEWQRRIEEKIYETYLPGIELDEKTRSQVNHLDKEIVTLERVQQFKSPYVKTLDDSIEYLYIKQCWPLQYNDAYELYNKLLDTLITGNTDAIRYELFGRC